MLQLVTPSVVAMAVRKEIAICKIVFQVFAFIIFIIIFNVKCYMLMLTWRGDTLAFYLPPSGEGFIQARRRRPAYHRLGWCQSRRPVQCRHR